MGKLTISMAIFNSYVKLPEGTESPTCSLNRLLMSGFPGKTWKSLSKVSSQCPIHELFHLIRQSILQPVL